MLRSRKNWATITLWIVLSVVGWLSPVSCTQVRGENGDVPTTWRDDADLRDVAFVDKEYGWAVGDHGTIWHTQNGGEIWRLQQSTVTCPLSSVHFVDRQHGWAAGGEPIPITQASKGTVLRTADGGQTWEEIDGLLLPSISGVRFSTTKTGIAVGESSALYPTGAWTTGDGGRTWSRLAGINGTHWVDHDLDRDSGVLMGHDGRIARLTKNRISASGVNSDGWNRQSFVAMVNGKIFFAGQDAPSLTVDSGRTWQSVGAFSPTGIEQRMQLRAMECVKEKCWLAGAPGNRILLSRDHGRNWQSVVTPSALPLERLYFIDNNTGWTVGARGTILSTKDGGATWKRQRGGMRRYAMLGVFADERDIPWSLISHASAVDEHRVHIVLLAQSNVDEGNRARLAQRVKYAAMQVGATAEVLTQIEIDPQTDLAASQVIAKWHAQYPSSVDWLAERLTQIIRARNPDVVLSSETGAGRAGQGVQRLTCQIVADACDYAASDQAFPQQFVDFGLSVWNVSRAVKCVANVDGTSRVKSKRLSARGRSAEELASKARRIVGVSGTVANWTLQSLRESEGQSDVGSDPFAGLVVEYGSAARRSRSQADGATSSAFRTSLAVARMSEKGIARVERIEQLAGQDSDLAGRLIFDLAIEEEDVAERDLLLRQFVARHEKHPLLDAALHQLVRHHTSLEQKWKTYREHGKRSAPVALANALVEETAISEDSVQLASAEEDTFAADWKPCLKLLDEIKSKRPMLYAEPEIALALAAAKRLDQPAGANTILERAKRVSAKSRRYAQLELDLVGSDAGSQTFDAWSCKASDQRPHLDGDLSDAIWKNAEFKPLNANQTKGHVTDQAPTLIAIAKDAEFLYLAAHCPKRPAIEYSPPRRKRPRDADLSKRDRIEVRFDINRDYRSWWSLSFDHRGWTRDALNDDLEWDPKYYVASQSNAEVWTIEVAIPLEELAPSEYRSSSYWSIDIKRVVPKMQVERWIPAHKGQNPPDLQGVMHLE